jgi:hypothetical protein
MHRAFVRHAIHGLYAVMICTIVRQSDGCLWYTCILCSGSVRAELTWTKLKTGGAHSRAPLLAKHPEPPDAAFGTESREAPLPRKKAHCT